MDGISQWWQDAIADPFYQTFIAEDRYMMILKGLGQTILITVLAVLIGFVLGFLIAVVRSTADRQQDLRKGNPVGRFILCFLNGFCKVYLTVFRGTPVIVQLLIFNFVIFTSLRGDGGVFFVAVLTFGLNSAAYVAEIFRSGIMSIDKGQFEAGRSLGFSYASTMIHIILPQAFKNVLPALGNEFIVLLKETSVVGYIAGQDLTRAATQIQSQTYQALFPMVSVAIIYLVMVMGLTKLVSLLERRLRNSEH